MHKSHSKAGKGDPIEKWSFRGGIFGIFIITILLCVFSIQSDDIFFYLTLGETFYNNLSFPVTDPFLFSIENFQWNIHHAWGTYVLSYALFQAGGWNMIIIGKTAIILSTVLLILIIPLKNKSRSPWLLLLILLAVYGSSFRFVARSSLFADLFTLTILLLILLRNRNYLKTKIFLVLVPLVFILWVNLHPGFTIGLILLAINIFCDVLKKMIMKEPDSKSGIFVSLLSLTLAILASLVNPRGIHGFLFPFRSVLSSDWEVFRKYNYEWMPTISPGYADSIQVKIFLAIAILGMIYFGWIALRSWHRRHFNQIPYFEILAFLFLIYLGFDAIRFMSVSLFGITLLLCVHISEKSNKLPGRKWIYHDAVSRPGLLVVCTIIIIYILTQGYTTPAGKRELSSGIDKKFHPVEAAEFLNEVNLQARLFNQHDFGSYLIWKWKGERKIYYHGYVDDLRFYENDYIGVSRSESDFNRVVDTYDIGAFMLTTMEISRNRGPLLYRLLLYSPDWHLVYMDEVALIFLKDIPENKTIIEKYSIMSGS